MRFKCPLKAQCLHFTLELNRGVNHSLHALEEAGKDRGSLGMTYCNQKTCRFVFHINLCSSQSERQKMTLCWWKWLGSSLVDQLANGSSRGKSRRYMTCFIQYLNYIYVMLSCYATLHQIIYFMIIYMYTYRYLYRYMSVNKWMVSRIHQAIKPTRFISAKHTPCHKEIRSLKQVLYLQMSSLPLKFMAAPEACSTVQILSAQWNLSMHFLLSG